MKDTEMAQTLCVDHPTIKEVFNRDTGELLSAQNAIGEDYSRVEGKRMRSAETVALKQPAYYCPICHVGVYLACQRKGNVKKFYFKHRVEKGNCPAVTRGKLTAKEIEARKFNGVKESAAHLRMKEIVAESLASDPEFSDIHVEQVWKGQDPGEWRKPDVKATWRGKLPVAFEIQLSTTFLHVIAQRRNFYLKEKALLCWIFQRFEQQNARMTQDDIFYNNNCNLLLASEQTLQASKDARALVLDCHWVEPTPGESGAVASIWQNKMARFSELEKDLERHRIFYFDHDGCRSGLEVEIRKSALLKSFHDWWARPDQPRADNNWASFRKQFAMFQVELPVYPSELRGLLNGIYSARAGRPVGFRHTKLISVAHTIVGQHPKALRVFRAAIFAYGRSVQLHDEDKPKPGEACGKLAKRSKEYIKLMEAGDPAYEPDPSQYPLIAFLFPEVWEQLQKWGFEM